MKVCWNITNICNEDCIYCFRELNESALPLEENIQILHRLYEAGVRNITFAGGEPLLYNGIEKLLEESKSLGIYTTMVTNGKFLNSSNLDKYLPYLDAITFSIDSPSEYVNKYSGRGKDHYEHLKNLLPFINACYPTLYIKVNSVVTKDTKDEVDYMFEAIANELQFYGVKEWKILRFLALRGHAKLRKEFLDLTDEEFDQISNIYDERDALFKISTRDKTTMEKNIVISPAGKIKKADNEEEEVLVEDIRETDKEEVVKKLLLGGHNHV